MRVKDVVLSGLLFLTAASGCGITMTKVVDPATGESMSVMQKNALCSVELVGSYNYLIDANTESCFLLVANTRSDSLVAVDCVKLKRKYAPAAKCITWLDGEAPIPVITPPAAPPR